MSRSHHLNRESADHRPITRGAILLLLLSLICLQSRAESPASAGASEGATQGTPGMVGQWWQQSKQTLGGLYRDASALFQTREQDPDFAQLWEGITPRLDRLLELDERHRELPESAWFGEDRPANREKIDRLLDEAMEILGISSAARLRSRMVEIDQQIASAQQRIDHYKNERVSAPIASPWRTTVADYEAKIRAEEEQIERLSTEAEKIRSELRDRLAQIGLHLSREQLEVLLTSVVGDDIIHSAVAFENVKTITNQLMTLMQESDEAPDIARRYYGMYTVLLQILIHTQQRFIEDIDESYLPGIDAILARAQEVEGESRRLLAQEADTRRAEHLRSNLRAQALTRQTARLYRQHLVAQRNKVQETRRKLEQEYRVASNTYETVKLSSELMQLLRAGQEAFDTLMRLQLPAMVVFENVQMREEFLKLTRTLSAGAQS